MNGGELSVRLRRALPVLTSLGVGLLVLVNSYYGMLHGNPLFTFLYRTFLGNILLLLYTTITAYVVGSAALESLIGCVRPRGRSLFKALVDALLTLSLAPITYSIVSLGGLRTEVAAATSLAYSYLVALTLKGSRGRLALPLLLLGLVYFPLTLLAMLYPEAVERNLREVTDLIKDLEEVVRILGLA